MKIRQYSIFIIIIFRTKILKKFLFLKYLKILKLTILGAFGAGVVATIIAKEMRKKKETEEIDE